MLGALVLLAFAIGIDAAIVEPRWIEVTRFTVRAPVERAIRIAHLSDLHTPAIGFRERSLLAILARERPRPRSGFLDSIAGRVPLVLAGHTHGGQVRVPFLPPLYLPAGSRPYVAGWYARGGTRMYVSRGIGESFIPVRFLCRPEVTFLTLLPGG